MTLIHYTAKVREPRLLELPEDANELHLQPGQEIEIQLDQALAVKPNTKMLDALDEIARRQKGRRYTDASQTDKIIREGRAGAMYDCDPS